MSATAPIFALALDVPNHTFSFPAREGAEIPGLADGWIFDAGSGTWTLSGAYGVVPGRAGRAQIISGLAQGGWSWTLLSPLALLPVFANQSTPRKTIVPVYGITVAMTGPAAYYTLALVWCDSAGVAISSVTLYSSAPGGDGVWRSITGEAASAVCPSTAVYCRLSLTGFAGASDDACSWLLGPVAVGHDHYDMLTIPSDISTGPGAVSPKLSRSFGVDRFAGRINRLPKTALRMNWPCLSLEQTGYLRFYWSSSRGSLLGRQYHPGGAVPTLLFPGNVAAPEFMVCDWAEDTSPIVPARAWGIPPIFRAAPLFTERL